MKKLIGTIGILALLFLAGCAKTSESNVDNKVDSTEVDSLVYDSVIVSHKTDTFNLDEDSVKVE